MTGIHKQWPMPAHWEDFEDMCYRLALAEGTIKSGRKYGRRGQEQYGVDIVGHTDDYIPSHIGIQCKLKTEHLRGKLTEADFINAYGLAKTLSPPLDKLYIATTSPRDTAVANLITRINSSWQRRHFVEAWCWEDICDLLDKHLRVTARYYPDLVKLDELQRTPKDPLELFLGAGEVQVTGERLSKLFDHAVFVRQFGDARHEVANALTEYVLNCLHVRKGKALRVAITLDGSELMVEDDGDSFNPLDEQFQPTTEQMGLRTIRRMVRNQLGLEVEHISRDNDDARAFNQFFIRVRAMEGIATSSCSVRVDAGVLFSRMDGYAFFDEMNIPSDCDPFTVHLGTYKHVTSSGSHEVLRNLKVYLGERKLVVVIAPHRVDLYEALVPAVRQWTNVSITLG